LRQLKVAILGNHRTSYCTECDLDWTFENLGHRVLKFQEDTGPTQVIAAQCESEKVDLFIYIHTHGWQTPGRLSFQEMIQRIKSAGAITCGFHLDLYWGLNASDRRTDRIGQHPFWKMDHVFTADGGHDEEFRARGVNHHWLPPAVVARDCRRGDFKPELAADVAFVGSRHYHPEYPFRTRLVDWLQRQYGPRFKHFGPYSPNGAFREQRLNDLYASVKVVVGDSCFAGSGLADGRGRDRGFALDLRGHFGIEFDGTISTLILEDPLHAVMFLQEVFDVFLRSTARMTLGHLGVDRIDLFLQGFDGGFQFGGDRAGFLLLLFTFFHEGLQLSLQTFKFFHQFLVHLGLLIK